MDSSTGYFTGCDHHSADRAATDSECLSIFMRFGFSCLEGKSDNFRDSYHRGLLLWDELNPVDVIKQTDLNGSHC